MSRSIAATAASFLVLFAWGAEAAGPVRPQQLAGVKPPGQPASGPGGATYAFSGSKSSEVGEGADSAVIFEPVPRPSEAAPVVVFLHGWGAKDPRPYQLWIQHLVRRGNYVIYPRYQRRFFSTMPAAFPATVGGIKAALAELMARSAPVDLNRFAMAGHSFGAMLAPILAAAAHELGLPEAKALLVAEPGGSKKLSEILPEKVSLSAVPSSTLIVFVVGDRDRVVGDRTARELFSMITSVPPERKNLLLMHSDLHGTPALIANHFAPVSQRQADALDYLGFWKLFDALTDAAFYGKNRTAALGGGPEQLGLGSWSDGVPVKPLELLK